MKGSFVIVDSEALKRLDVVFNEHLGEYSRSHIKNLIDEGKILLNDKECKAGEKVKSGDKVDYQFEELKPLEVEPEDIDFEILDSDLKIDTYRSGGAGGQHVNKTESAIRITHLPTGIVVTCQDERSQLKNKEKAMNILKSKLYDYYREQRDSEYEQNRKSQVGRGNRNERIRTYNYPQGRVTDHRTNLSSYDLEGVLNGNIEEFIDAMIIKERTELLANL